MLQRILLGVGQVAHQRACSAGPQAVFLAETQRGQILQVEMAAQRVAGVLVLIPGGGLLGAGGVLPAQAGPQAHQVVGDDLDGLNPGHFIRQGVLGRGNLMDEKLARGHIRESQPRLVPREAHGQQEVVRPLVQHVVLDDRTRGHNADHVSLHKPLGQGGILQLLADGHLVALGDELFHIGVDRVVGYAAHGGALLQAAVPPGQGQLQLPGGLLRIVEEHFIKIAQAEKQQAILILRLQVQVLLHHGRESHRTLSPYLDVKKRCAFTGSPRRSRSRRSSRRSRCSRPIPFPR